MDTSTIIGLTVFVLVVIGLVGGIAAGEKMRAAKTAYQNSLQALKGDPTNADLRQTTLELGRSYSQLTRKNNRVALFDEMALANDINAAAGSSTVTTSSRPTPVPAMDRLQELARLKESGLISEAEYAAKRGAILGDL
jgi:hypothetical protein